MSEINYQRIYNDPDGFRYILLDDWVCVVPLLQYVIKLKAGMKSDGATWARDLGAEETGWRKYWAKYISWLMHSPKNHKTDAWFVHDDICNTGKIEGKPVSNFIASLVLSLLLWKDRYKREAFSWFFATWLGGGGQARKNGMFWLKSDVKKKYKLKG